MATTESQNVSVENPILNRLKGKKTPESTTDRNRKTLSTLQYSSKGGNQLIGQNDENKLTKIKPSSKPVKIFADIKKSALRSEKPCDHSGTQTDDSLLEDLIEAKVQRTEIERRGRSREEHLTSSLKLSDGESGERGVLESDLTEAEPSENYWRELAEKRRQALNDTLEENEILHHQNISLREENEKLTEVASQAENMVSFLQSVVCSDEDAKDEDAKDEGSKEKHKKTTSSVDDEWLNIEIEGEVVKSTEVVTSTPEATLDTKS